MGLFSRLSRKSGGYSIEDVNKAATAAVLDARQELLDESHSRTDLLFADEDLGFIRLGDNKSQSRVPEQFRRETVMESRLLSIIDTISKQSIGLYTDFSVGTGANITVKSDKDPIKDKATEIIKSFINNTENKQMLNSQGQRALSDQLLVDGEIFFALFTGKNGEVIIRTIDALEMRDIATDPDDDKRPRFYLRVKQNRLGTTSKKIFYRDWNNLESKPGELANGDAVAKATNDALIFHVKLQAGNLRGYPLIMAQIRWSRAYRNFMKSRIAIQQGLARIIKSIKIKGGSRLIDKVKSKLQSSKVGVAGPETNPAPIYGSTQIENMAADTTNVKQETGANAAKVDGSMLMAMAGASVGIFPHYYGFGESFRLATATAMENPMLKRFEAYRKLWIETNEMIFLFVLEQNKVDTKQLSFDINYPDIFPKAMVDKIEAITNVSDSFPALKISEPFVQFALDELGITDSEDMLKGIDLQKDNETPEQRVAMKKAEQEAFRILRGLATNEDELD